MRGPVKTKTVAPVVEAPPTLARALETLAYHMGEIMTYRPGPGVNVSEVTTGFGLGGYGGCPLALVRFTIKAMAGADPWGPGAGVYVDGVCIGSRAAGRNALAAAYTPIIAWIAAREAAPTAAASESAAA